MKISNIFLSAVLLVSATFSVNADEFEEDRKAMRVILSDIEQALNDQDIDAVLKHVHEDAVITYYNAEVTKGHKEARDYYQRMIKSSSALVKEYSTKGEVGAPAVIYGDIAVAFGTTVENYKLASGLEFTLNGRWSTTLLKSDNRWEVIALHFSTDLFDNPLLNNAARTTWIAGVVAFVVGGLLVFGVMRFRSRKT